MERCPKCGWYHTDECMGGSMVADHNPTIRSTRTPILVSAMRLLAQEIQSEDGVANAAIAEAGNRLADLESELERSNNLLEDVRAAFKQKFEVLETQLSQAQQGLGEGVTRPHDGPENCPTYYDGCNCTVEALTHNIKRAQEAEAGLAVAKSRIQALEMQAPGYAEIERKRIIGLLLATNPMDVSICDPIHGDAWIEACLRDLLEPKP